MASKKMTLLLALVTSITVSACGKIGVKDPQFLQYVERFETEAKARGVAVDTTWLDMTFVDDLKGNNFTPNTVGACYFGSEVKVKKTAWKKFSDTERELLVFHELGHCVLNHAEHSSCPNIMCATMVNQYEYTFSRQAWLDVLFKK